MKKTVTELVFILDKSGSMAGLEADTIGGYNAMLKKQKESGGEVRLTTVLFDNQYHLLHDRLDLKSVSPITHEDYYVGGSTALLDAMGHTIQKIDSVRRHTAAAYRADKVLFVITTDGMENASREYSHKKIKSMVEHQKEEYGWEFIFLGANIDAVETAEQFGIGANRAQSYHSDKAGTQLNYQVLSDTVCEFVKKAAISPDWNAEIAADFAERSNTAPGE